MRLPLHRRFASNCCLFMPLDRHSVEAHAAGGTGATASQYLLR